jgi:hypothetical protein
MGGLGFEVCGKRGSGLEIYVANKINPLAAQTTND